MRMREIEVRFSEISNQLKSCSRGRQRVDLWHGSPDPWDSESRVGRPVPRQSHTLALAATRNQGGLKSALLQKLTVLVSVHFCASAMRHELRVPSGWVLTGTSSLPTPRFFRFSCTLH
jgi:hypothetical protein